MVRIPVTQEFIGDSLAAMSRGETVNHPAISCFHDALHDGIYKLIHSRAHKFRTTIKDPESDLFQGSFLHLLTRIKTYDSRRGKFSTWSFQTVTNYLRRYYNEEKARLDFEVEMSCEHPENQEGSELMCENNIVHHASNALICHEIASTVSALIKKYPAQAGITVGVFGTPEDISVKRKFPDTIVLRTIKGYKKAEKERFFYKCIVPAFRERFGGLHV